MTDSAPPPSARAHASTAAAEPIVYPLTARHMRNIGTRAQRPPAGSAGSRIASISSPAASSARA